LIKIREINERERERVSECMCVCVCVCVCVCEREREVILAKVWLGEVRQGKVRTA